MFPRQAGKPGAAAAPRCALGLGSACPQQAEEPQLCSVSLLETCQEIQSITKYSYCLYT